MNNELFSLCERLLTALLNSAYQGVLLAMLVWKAPVVVGKLVEPVAPLT